MLKNLVNVAMVLLVCLFAGCAKECKSDKDKVNGCVVKEYDESGNIEVEIPYENGRINGVVKEYYESGKLGREIPYENDKQNGVEKWYYENGKLEKEIPYENGKQNGVVKEYDKQGKPI